MDGGCKGSWNLSASYFGKQTRLSWWHLVFSPVKIMRVSWKKGVICFSLISKLRPFFQETLHFLFIILKWDIGDFYLSPLLQDKTACTLIFFCREHFSIICKNLFRFRLCSHYACRTGKLFMVTQKLSSKVWTPVL